MSADPAAAAEGGEAAEAPRADVRLSRGRLAPDELAAIAVVVSAMSVTSRMEAEERDLAEGIGGENCWADAIRTHPRSHALRGLASPSAWQFSDR